MITTILTVLVAFDLILLIYVSRLKTQKNPINNDLLQDITEERNHIVALQKNVEEDLAVMKSTSRDILKKISTIATELELEIKTAKKELNTEMSSIANTMVTQFETPLSQLSKKQMTLNALFKKIELEKKSLNRSIRKAQMMITSLADESSYHNAAEKLEKQKYKEARKLLVNGLSPEEIALDLGLELSEIKLL